MTVTWTISQLERNTDGDVVVAHWRAAASEVVGTGSEAVTHSGSIYGTVGFTPNATTGVYTAYKDITEAKVIKWVKTDVDVDAVEAQIAAQIADSKEPAITVGVPW